MRFHTAIMHSPASVAVESNKHYKPTKPLKRSLINSEIKNVVFIKRCLALCLEANQPDSGGYIDYTVLPLLLFCTFINHFYN